MSRPGPRRPRSGAPDAELGAVLPGQRLRDRATRPPVDPRLLRIDRAVPALLCSLALLALLTAAALVVQSAALAAIISRSFLDGAELSQLRWWLAALAVAVVVRALSGWARDVVAQRTAARVKSRLRRRAVAAVTDAPHDAASPPAGETAALLTDGIDALDGTFGGYLPALVAGLVIPVALLVAVVQADAASAVVLAVTLPLIPLFMVLVGLAARSVTRRRFAALTALSGQLLAALEGAATVRVTRALERVAADVRLAAQRLRATTLQTLRVAFLSALVLELLAALGVATVAVIAGVRLAQGTGTLEPLLFALLLAPEAFLPLRQVGQQFHANEDGAAATERVLELIDAPSAATSMSQATAPGSQPVAPEVTVSPDAGPQAAGSPGAVVALRGVAVGHPGRAAPALSGVDLELAPGEQVAVLGASGAGKSTLAAVLVGLREPDEGEVVRHRPACPADSTAPVAWVPQAPAPLRGTVREVVAMGAGRVDDAVVRSVLAEVGLDAEVAALPDGLDTLIGPGGRGLSAGQSRRVALARALLSPVPLMVLDEPTGDLDVAAELRVRQALRHRRGARAVVVCTHRVAVAAEADRVVVLDAGRVVEDGPPGELLARDGAYAQLVAAARPLEPSEVELSELALEGGAAEAGGVASGPTVGAADGLGVASGPTVGAADGLAEPGAAGRQRRRPAAGTGGLHWRRLLRPHARPLTVAVGAGALTPLAGVALVAVSTYLISRAALQPNILDLGVAVAGVRALSILKGVSRYVERLAGHDVALRVVGDLRLVAFRRLVPQAPAGLARYRGGELLTRLVSDVERLQLALVRAVVPLLGGFVAVLVIVAAAGLLLPVAAAVVLAGLVVAGVVVPLLAGGLARRPERRLAQARGELGARLVELLAAAPELRLLGRLDDARRTLAQVDAEVEGYDRSAIVRGGGSDALVQLTLGATLVGLVAVAVPAVAAGRLDGVLLGVLLVLVVAATEAVAPLPSAARALVSVRRATARLAEVLEAPPPAPDPAAPIPLPAAADLCLARATAQYPGADAAAVEEVSLELWPGRRVAVIGRSGAGKSTVASLAVRFLDPVAGAVRLGGADLRALRGDDVRARVALAPQAAHLFDGSIADNLRLARPDASDADLHAVLADAQLERFVASLPRGLATPVGDGGRSLSGGQRHRLVLARTLLVGAPLLVFDEPTADLDPATGRAFLNDLLRAASPGYGGDGRQPAPGVVLLTHDLRVLPLVDEVVVIERGRVVARGSHRALLGEDPGYAARVRLEVAALNARTMPCVPECVCTARAGDGGRTDRVGQVGCR